MSQAAPALAETVLCEAYRAEADCYARALHAAAALPATLSQGQTADEQLHALTGLLAEVAAIEARIAQAKQDWQRSGHKPGPELKTVLDHVADLIERLARCLHDAEQEAAQQKSRLAPQLDDLTRGQQMQRAYQVAMNAVIAPSDR